MDSVFGDCWKCQQPSKGIKCEKCLVAEYCRPECRFKHRFIHEPFCNSSIILSTCSYCKTRSNDLKKCSGCYSSIYCNTNCQKNHWALHKQECKRHQKDIIQQSLGIMGSQYTDLPWYLGSSLAEDYLNLRKNEGISWASDLKILFVGVGDIKDVIKTVISLPKQYSGKIEFVLNDFSPHIMARNILFLYCVLLKKEFSLLIQVWYSLLLKPSCLTFLINVLENLINNKRDILHPLKNFVEISDSHWENCIDIWKGWLKLANDPKACQNIVDHFQEKLMHDTEKVGLQFYYDTSPEFHNKSLKAFFEKNSFLPLKSSQRQEAKHGNPLFTCFNPMKEEYEKKYPDLNKTGPLKAGWLRSVELDMIHCVRTSAFAFTCWDYLEVRKRVELDSDVIQMYVSFLEKHFKKFATSVNENKIHFRLILDDFQKLNEYLSADEKFDRIGTSNLCDYFVTPFVLEKLAPLLNRDNKHSVLICRHENWPGFTFMYDKIRASSMNGSSLLLAGKDMRERPEVFGGLPDANRLMCLKLYEASSEDYVDPNSFLFSKMLSEILAYRHQTENLPFDKTSFQHLVPMATKFGMKFRDFRMELNHVIPFQREANIRRVSLMRNNCRYVEWYPIPRD